MTTVRRHVPFDALWKMRIDVPYSLMLRDGDVAWSCGQCPLDAQGEVLAPGDLPAQTALVADIIDRVLSEAGLTAASIAKLVVYFVDTGVAPVAAMLGIMRDRFGPNPLLVPVAIPHFYYDGMLIEIDVHAALGVRRRADLDGARGELTLRHVEAGDLAWATLSIRRTETAPLAGAETVAALLGEAGFGPATLLSSHWFAADGDGRALDVADEAGFVADPGLAVTTPLDGRTRAVGALVFSRDRSAGPVVSHRADHDGVRLTARQAGGRFWVAARGTTEFGSLVAETQAIMRAVDGWLRAQALDFAAVVKSTTHYRGEASASELHDNMAVRNAYYTKPGPASTGLPVSAFARSPGRISVDLLGVAGDASGAAD